MLDTRTKALVRAVLYPVQFESQPEAGIDRVITQVIVGRALHATPTDYMNAIRLALESRDECLSGIIPRTHSENVVRSYLQQLSAALLQARAGLAATAAAGPLATSWRVHPEFWSIKITADVRDYAAGLSDNEKAALYPDAAKQGMADMSKKFLDMGAEVYVEADKAKGANKAL